MEIGKITSKFGVLYIEYSERQTINDAATTVVSKQQFQHVAHPDLMEALEKIIPHLVLLTEQAHLDKQQMRLMHDVRLIRDHFKDYKVTGFSLKGSEDNLSIVIIGQRTLSNGKTISLCTPNQKFNDENDHYDYASELFLHVDKVRAEAELYMSGKAAPSPQTEMDFEEENQEGVRKAS